MFELKFVWGDFAWLPQWGREVSPHSAECRAGWAHWLWFTAVVMTSAYYRRIQQAMVRDAASRSAPAAAAPQPSTLNPQPSTFFGRNALCVFSPLPILDQARLVCLTRKRGPLRQLFLECRQIGAVCALRECAVAGKPSPIGKGPVCGSLIVVGEDRFEVDECPAVVRAMVDLAKTHEFPPSLYERAMQRSNN